MSNSDQTADDAFSAPEGTATEPATVQPALPRIFTARASVSTLLVVGNPAGTAAAPGEAVRRDAGQGEADRLLALAKLALEKNRRQKEMRSRSELPKPILPRP